MLLFGKIEFFMGGDQIGDFLSAESKLPLIAVAADFQKSPQIFMSHPGVGLDKWEDLPHAKPVYVGAAIKHVLWLAEARLRIQGREQSGRTISIRRHSFTTRCQSSRVM